MLCYMIKIYPLIDDSALFRGAVSGYKNWYHRLKLAKDFPMLKLDSEADTKALGNRLGRNTEKGLYFPRGRNGVW